ncbi:trypsin-like serine peptidase, partial [Streptomyces sp. NPDC050504]|uniref:trypsin-like serine peptidase n=1 Tax=Streptomyces sp. NPDC050504 TaxID=3365618 RepID=UPI0037B2BC6A
MRKIRTITGVLTALALATATAGCTTASSASQHPGARGKQQPRPTQSAAVSATATVPAVGVLVDDDPENEGEHWCSASVVDSPRGNVVATAAHCVYEHKRYAADFSFAPSFSGRGKGTAPYGTWRVTKVEVDPRWRADGDDSEAYDYAFLTLAPDAKGRSVQEVVGGLAPDWASGPERRVTVFGYPGPDHNPTNRPIMCTTDTARDEDLAAMIRMECAGFFDGTSGGPWLADYRAPDDRGRLIGVMSGGDTDSESTAVLFDAHAKGLYERAAGGRGGPRPPRAPAPPPPGGRPPPPPPPPHHPPPPRPPRGGP